ncbi:MAG: hypothetical protein PHI27_13410 [Eubacteriales bacterium]|nr:hypothetical protein [Eubacteriales bacterium]MDD3883221.1 hypothetical protein [Eubacteriales bacterium]
MMREAKRIFTVRLLGLITALTGCFSALLMLASGGYGESYALLMLPLVPALFCAPVSLLKRALRIPLFAALVFLSAALAYLFCPIGLSAPLKFIFILFCAAVTMAALPAMYHEQMLWEVTAAILLTLLGAVLSGVRDFVYVAQALRIQGTVFICLLLIYMNLAQLTRQSLKQKTNSTKGAVRSNVLMTAIVIAIAILIASYKTLLALVKRGLDAAWRLLKKVMELFALKPSTEGGEMDGGSDIAEFFGMEGEPSQFLLTLEKIAIALAAVAAAVLAAWLIKKLCLLIKRLVRLIIGTLRRYMKGISQSGDGYTDETEQLADRAEKDIPKKKRTRQRKERWERLTGSKKVRYLYRMLVKSGESPLTARETLKSKYSLMPDAAGAVADAYDRARYGESEIPDRDAEALKALADELYKHRD